MLQQGSNSRTFDLSAGVHKLKLDSAVGRIRVRIQRNDVIIAEDAPMDFYYTNTPIRCMSRVIW